MVTAKEIIEERIDFVIDHLRVMADLLEEKEVVLDKEIAEYLRNDSDYNADADASALSTLINLSDQLEVGIDSSLRETATTYIDVIYDY